MPYTEFGVPTKKPHPKAFILTAEPASSLVMTTKSHTTVSKCLSFLKSPPPVLPQPTFSYLSLANWASKMGLQMAYSIHIINQCQAKQAWLITPTTNKQT